MILKDGYNASADWDEIARDLHPVSVNDDPVLIRKRSRDFFWYSPLLNAQLRYCFGNLVALPGSADEMSRCLSTACKHVIPVILRGGGTGNYGQSVPLMGGLIIDTTGMSKIISIGDETICVESGALMADINAALLRHGREMAMYPSTQDMATIGGFVAGGSSGIGSVANGVLRDKGNIIQIKALSVEEEPREHVFNAEESLHVHHAWGINGAITQVTLRTVPARNWIGCMATFDSYQKCYAAGYALAESRKIGRKLCSTVDARIAEYFPRLKGHLREGMHLLLALVPKEDMPKFDRFIAGQGGNLDLAMTERQLKAANLPQLHEFAYNHTTLQILKADRSATYQQIGVRDASCDSDVAAVAEVLGDDVWPHHEFARVNGRILAFDLPIIWFSDERRLREIDSIYAEHGHHVADAHSFHIEGGGMKNADYRHLAWKKRLDPLGLLNPGKSRTWEKVRHLSASEIESMQSDDGK
ncbi:MAG: FAD-binding oxidoreductase [Roseovarius sp.]|nr:FAD-binding oxidoreductase [Roseovarius sp.]